VEADNENDMVAIFQEMVRLGDLKRAHDMAETGIYRRADRLAKLVLADFEESMPQR
jgi:hypothetical protein